VLEIVESFWKLVSKDRFPKLKDFATKMHSVFGNTHMCESTFSTMKQVKSKNRNRIAKATLNDSLRLAPLTLILIKERQCGEALTTGIPLMGICNKLLLCNDFNDTVTYLPFLVSNVVNLLFYLSFYWEWPASWHVFVKWAVGQKVVEPRWPVVCHVSSAISASVAIGLKTGSSAVLNYISWSRAT